MTQEVQPLTWQKRTNIEEHQQFFAKINEIIANLAPTVGEAEAAIAQATQAIASANSAIANANDAVETANAASAAASAAASQAQTAASTVEGYGDRLSAAESKNSQQDTAIGALQTADAQNVKIDRINEYAVGLTGNQTSIAGYKTFNKYLMHSESGNQYGFVDQRTDINITALTGTSYKNVLKVIDADNNNLAVLEVRGYANGTTAVFIKVRNSDGSTKTVTLGAGDVI